jgi:transcriptional regulator with XRE-family HTH domain
VNDNFDNKLILLGNKIKLLRNEKNITQQFLSSYCDVDIRTIQRIESGKQNPTYKLLLSISNCLNISISDLLNF